MQKKWLKQSLIFVNILFVTTANAESFLLSTPDEGVVGNGSVEIQNHSTVNTKILFQGENFSGKGELKRDIHAYVFEKTRQGIRADRALLQALTGSAKKQAKVVLRSPQGSSLVCEFTPQYESISGQCINPTNQQNLSIKSKLKELT